MSVVYEVDPAGFARGRGLFESAGVDFDRPYWEACFDGDFPGRLFLDDPVSPGSAVLARTYEYFLAGTPSSAIIDFLVDAPASANPLEWFYGYVPLTSAWLDALLGAVPGLVREERRSFRLGSDGAMAATSWSNRIPDGIRVVRLDPDIARRADAELSEVIEIICGSYARFPEPFFGYAAIDETSGQMLSVAFTAGVSAREVNLAVGTAETARRRGLGRLLCQACSAQARERGLSVTWDCDLANTASGLLAESMGFIEESPFVELAFADPVRGLPFRVTPSPTGVAWDRSDLPDGAVQWTQRPTS